MHRFCKEAVFSFWGVHFALLCVHGLPRMYTTFYRFHFFALRGSSPLIGVHFLFFGLILFQMCAMVRGDG